MPEDRMLKWFDYTPTTNTHGIGPTFSDLAKMLVREIAEGPERTVALRKLLEARDAAVRAARHPGG